MMEQKLFTLLASLGLGSNGRAYGLLSPSERGGVGWFYKRLHVFL